jgi:hypothetical protein
MTAAGCAFFAVSWGIIVGLNVFCLIRLGRLRNDRPTAVEPPSPLRSPHEPPAGA